MTTANSIAIFCPKCKEKFKTIIIMSYGYKVRTTDLRPVYWGHNPMPSFVARCPYCFFADHIHKFENAPYPGGDEMLDTYEAMLSFMKSRREELKNLRKGAVTNGASERFEIARRLEREGGSLEEIANTYKDAINAIRMNFISPSPFTYPSIFAIPPEIDAECAQKHVKAFESSSNPENVKFAYIAAEHFRLAQKFELALKWYEIYCEAIEDIGDPPASIDLVRMVEKEAKKHNSEELYIVEEEEGGNFFIKGLNS